MSGGSFALRMQVVLEGAPELIRRVQLMETRQRERTKGAIRRGTHNVVTRAQRLVPKRTRELESTIRAEFSRDGMVGYAKAGYGQLLRRSKSSSQSVRFKKAKARREERQLQLRLANTSKQAFSVADLGIYAMVVEFGDRKRNKPRRPFMNPAFAQETPAIRKDLQQALQKSADEVTR